MDNEILLYLTVEMAIILSPVLTKEDRIFYIALKSFRNRQSKMCFPGMARVVKRARICKETAYSCRTKLETLGVIRWISKRGRKHSCHYEFILEDGDSTEISIALDNLKGKKIVDEKTSLNSRSKDHLNSRSKDLKIVDGKDTNHMNITKGTVKREKALSLHTQNLLEHFSKIFKQKHDVNYVVKSKDEEGIKEILKHHSVDWIKDAMDRFMNDTDAYFNKVGRSFSVFVGQINTLASTGSHEIDWSKY